MDNYEKLMFLLQQSGLFQQQRETLHTLHQQEQRNELTVSVVGQFKRGKSSLINAFLGEPLLPVAITPLTSVVTELRQGQDPRALVCFREGADREIQPSEIGRYCGEKENPHNEKGVRTVRLWTPHQPFGTGTVLVDTPGIGSTNQENTRETLDYLIHSDAVIFILSVDSPVNELERQFLQELRPYCSRLWIVVNKADMAEEDELQEFLTYSRSVLESELNRPVKLFPVSAKTMKGVEELKRLLQQELALQREQLRRASVRRKQNLVLRQLQVLLAAAEQTAHTAPETLRARRNRFTKQQQALLAYGETLRVLAGHQTERLVSEIGADLHEQRKTVSQLLENRGEELARELSGLPWREFKVSYQERLEQELRVQLEQLNERGLKQLHTGFGEVMEKLTENAYETERAVAKAVREEFQLEYPLTEEKPAVSGQEDFYLSVDLKKMPRLYLELKDRLLPRKTAQARFLMRCQGDVEETLECNVNNMLYNYRYKMQESLRPLCRRLEERVQKAGGELENLIHLMELRLCPAEREQEEKTALFSRLQEVIRAMLDGEGAQEKEK